MTKSLSTIILALLVLAAIACFLPWGWHPTAGLTTNALDLAEWTTLYPPNQQAQPPLLPSLALRLSIGVLAMALVFHAQVLAVDLAKFMRWGAMLISAVLAVALLPPFEFLSNLGDPNYRQQLAIVVVTVLGAGALWWFGERLQVRLRWGVEVVLAGLAVLLGLLGLIGGLNQFEQLGMPVQPGLGGILFIGSMGIAALMVVYQVAIPRNRGRMKV